MTGLSNRDANLRGSTEVLTAHCNVDADGCDRPFYGRVEPDGPLDDAVQHHAKRQHYEHHVDERHGHGRLSRHGLHGDVHVACELPQRPRAGRIPFVVTLGPKHSEQEESREDLMHIGGAQDFRLIKVFK